MELAELKQITTSFTTELEKAKLGQPSSLKYIRNQLPASSPLSVSDRLQVIVIGGSNFQNALLRKTDSGFEIESREEGLCPVFDTKESFCAFIADNRTPGVSYMAINFAFALEPMLVDNILDGKLLFTSKEHAFEGLQGQYVGQAVQSYVKQKDHTDLHVAVANDTACLLFSGLLQHTPENLACGIVGTGMNIGFFDSENCAVILESGSFDKFQRSNLGLAIDAQSQTTGIHVSEKEISGAYLYRLYNYALEQDHLAAKPIESTEALNEIAMGNFDQATDLAQSLVTRSASLMACQIAATTQFKHHDCVFVMQGSLFWKAYEYKEIVANLIEQLVPEYRVTFTKVEHADIFGAAKIIG